MTFVAGTVLTAAALNSELAAKSDLAMVQNAQTGTSYTFVLADQTKLVTLSNAAAVAVTLPLEATVAWPTGTQLRLLNQGAGTVTVAGAVGVTINGTPLTLAQYKGAVLTKISGVANTWTFLPFSGGSAPAVISSTTGSPTITTRSDSKSVYKWSADGTVVIGTAGTVGMLVVGAGASGGKRGSTVGGGGGGGGVLALQDVYLAAGTYTIVVGVGGAGQTSTNTAGNAGGHSRCGLIYAYGGAGGGGAGVTLSTPDKATGGGGDAGASTAVNGGTALVSGFAGGNGAVSSGAGGGGGASAVGANGTNNTGGAGGAGISNTFETLSAQTYGAGGGGAGATTQGAAGGTGASAGVVTTGTSTAGVNGSGGGSGGAGGSGANSGKGGDGVVIMVIG